MNIVCVRVCANVRAVTVALGDIMDLMLMVMWAESHTHTHMHAHVHAHTQISMDITSIDFNTICRLSAVNRSTSILPDSESAVQDNVSS